MDFDNFSKWNPFMKQISGDPEVGSRIHVFLQPPNSRGILFNPKILEFKPEEKIRWLGHLWVPKIFDGEHSLIIKKRDTDNVLFIQKEEFTGILVPILGGLLKDSKKGFEMMNKALKEEAEKK